MRAIAVVIAKLLLAYFVAGATLVMYVMLPNSNGYADVPLSGFPEFFIWSPFAPALIASEFSTHPGNGLASLLIYCTTFSAVAWFLFAWRNK